jgi:murein DD-endopeptidase MepM/ murein hydrolase activator NlpD
MIAVSSRLPRVALVLLIGSLVLAALTPAVQAVTKSEVEEACVDSREALGVYREARGRFDEAARELEQINFKVDETAAQTVAVRSRIADREDDLKRLMDRFQDNAVEMYMQGVMGTALVFSAGSSEEIVAGTEYLSVTAGDDLNAINELAALRSDLAALQNDLALRQDQLEDARTIQETITADQESAMEATRSAYERLDGRCRELQSQYEREQAKLRAAEEARRAGRSTAAGMPGLICPFTPGRTQFINSWGFARSGGRSHQGTDMFASWNEPVYAVASGRVAVANHGIGGKHIWLTADDGTGYYYAHLNDFAVGDDQSVQKGELIGFNGNSGNADGTSPHVHFQIHPGGRGGSPINPYSSVAAVCF